MCNNTEDNGFGEETERFFSPANALTFAGLTAAFATHPEPPGVYALFGNTLIYSARYGMRPAGAPAFAAVTGVVAQSKLAASDAGRLTWEKLADLATITSSTVQYVQRSYYYDKRGRLRQQVETGPLSGTLRTSLRYDYVGSEDRRSVSGTLGGATSTLDRTAFFDSRSRLLRESAILGMKTAAVRHGYDALGRHKCDSLTASGTAGIVTDTYDIRSQLTSRTAKKGSTNLFSETLRYADPARGAAARYGGRLSEVMTQQGSSTANTYGYSYDVAGQLTATTRFTGTSGSGVLTYTERDLTYNRNGALLTLKRYGSSGTSPQDNYTYSYSGPLLTSVGNSSFTHDANGNTTADGVAGLNYTYNVLNLPDTVKSGSTVKAIYHWLADGTKYRVVDASGNGVIYAGDLTYTVAVSGGNTTYALESVEASADGTARFLKNGTAMTPYYTIWDHLGSVRTIVNASGSVVERNDYYPFGQRTTFGASYATLSANRQKFSGKEDQTTVASSTLPYLDFGARMYDPKLVRWNTYDPMAEKYYRINPYVYCAGDPVNLVDPEGTHIWTINQNGEVLNKKKDKSQDAFVLVDEKGQQVCFITFKYKTVKSVKKHTKIRVGETEKEISTILLSNTEAGADLFKLFADNSDKEYGFITMKNENSLVMTSHEPSSIPISLKAKELDRKWETKVTRIIHSHPNNTPPSGYDQEYTGRGDKTGAGLVKKAYHYVYQPGTGLLIPYDNKEIKPSIKWEIVFPKSIIK